MDVEDCCTFSLRSYSKQAGDEHHLIRDISFTPYAGYLGYPFEKFVARRLTSGISIEDAIVFREVESARRTLSLSGTCS